MAYEVFKKELNKEDYFNSWDAKNYNQITEDLKQIIYNKYLMKVRVFNRDNFICQNQNCPFCHNEQYHKKLTIHHIRAKRNDGKDTERNGVTLCKSAHQHYEKAKGPITISDNPKLPNHIRGHTYKLSKPIMINWKKVKADMKLRRKELRELWGIRLTNEQIEMLMKFLQINFNDLD